MVKDITPLSSLHLNGSPFNLGHPLDQGDGEAEQYLVKVQACRVVMCVVSREL